MVDLYLLHYETILRLKAIKDLTSSEFIYSLPCNYKNQVPVLFNIRKDSSEKIIKSYIQNDKNHPNKRVHFIISHLQKNETIKIHFECWILVKNNKFNALPKNTKLSKRINLPNEVEKWLISSESIQSNNIIIRFKSKLLKGFNKDIISFSKKVIISLCFHRILLQNLRLFLEINPFLRSKLLRKSYYTGLMDALSYYFFGGLCCAQTNYAAAILRADGIPTRILITTRIAKRGRFAGEKTWLDSHHYMFEFYCPGYGWIVAEPGRIAPQPKNYIISKIVYPEDENIAGNGLSYYGGMSPWFWISNNDVELVFPEEMCSSYKKPKGNVSGVPGIRLWTESKINMDKDIAEIVFNLTKKVWELFVKNYSFENNHHVTDIDNDLEQTIECFKNSDIKGYEMHLKKVLKKLERGC
jgi:hypothetical protein